MTAIYYPDLTVATTDGRFRLEAKSPHNGTIDHRDGTPPSESEFPFKYRDHQSEFRYRLLDDRDRILWERWQGEQEDSPRELLVSNEGWSILRTHGFAPEIIAVSPDGKGELRVKLLGDEDLLGQASPANPGNTPVWRLKHLQFSTAGKIWSLYSWSGFFEFEGRSYFGWRASWGQRLVIDLEALHMLSETEQTEPTIADALSRSEIRGVRIVLEEFSPIMGQVRELFALEFESKVRHPLFKKLHAVFSAILLVGIHRIRDCLPHLRVWEELDYVGSSTPSTAMENLRCEIEFVRRKVHHALRLLDEEPIGLPTYHFLGPDGKRLPIPERIPDRYTRAKQVGREMTAVEVLERIGSPDHVKRKSHKDGKFYRWTERWEYDFRLDSGWVTMRINWEQNEQKGRIIEIGEFPSEWLLTDDREADILRL